MKMKLLQFMVLVFGLATVANSYAAADSYRFLHVTIETPWAIFIFLLGFILIPFVLMAALYWYFAYKKGKEEASNEVDLQQTTVGQQQIHQQTTVEKTPD